VPLGAGDGAHRAEDEELGYPDQMIRDACEQLREHHRRHPHVVKRHGREMSDGEMRQHHDRLDQPRHQLFNLARVFWFCR
jgi:hypothetical protein